MPFAIGSFWSCRTSVSMKYWACRVLSPLSSTKIESYDMTRTPPIKKLPGDCPRRLEVAYSATKAFISYASEPENTFLPIQLIYRLFAPQVSPSLHSHCWLQRIISVRMGTKLSPSSVSVYSTLGGISR